MESIRLNKYLSDAGICSRRQADRWIEEKRITVNGEIAGMGMKVAPDSEVCLDGKLIKKEEKKVLLAMNKPAGIVCTAEKRERNNIVDYMKYPKRIYPVGRLDRDTTGLLLITSNGQLGYEMLLPEKKVSKTYQVVVNERVTPADVTAFENGIVFADGYQCKPADLKILKADKHQSTVLLTIQEGKFHQVKRMFEAVGKSVVYLKRTEFGTLPLDEDLEEGEYRELTEEELAILKSF